VTGRGTDAQRARGGGGAWWPRDRRVALVALATPAIVLPLLPVVYVLQRALDASASDWSRVLGSELVPIAARSLALAGLVAVVAVLVAVPYAVLVVRTDLPGRRWWAVIGALPLVIPSYVGAFALLGALGPRGLLSDMLVPLGIDRLPDLRGFLGSAVVLTLFTYPYVLLLVVAALRRVDPSLERAARGMGRGPWQAFATATLPQLRGATVAGSLLVALYVLGDFGVVSIMRTSTFTREIYLRYGVLLDRDGAAILGLALVVLTVLVLVLERRVLRGTARAASRSERAAGRQELIALGPLRWPALAFCSAVAGLALVVPIGTLLWWLLTRASRVPLGEQLASTVAALADTVLLSGAGALACVLVALPVAMLAARHPSRLATAMESATYLGYALPGLVAALGLVLLALGAAPWAYQTAGLVVIAYVVRFLPQSVGATRAAIQRVDPRLEDAARGMGAGHLTTLRSVTLPLAAPGVLAGALLVFLTATKELPATLVLRPTGMDTLATEVWARTAVSDFAGAALPALAMVALGAVPLYLLVVRPGMVDRSSTPRTRRAVAASTAGD
jgi:iron(III) transport system permease protein